VKALTARAIRQLPTACGKKLLNQDGLFCWQLKSCLLEKGNLGQLTNFANHHTGQLKLQEDYFKALL
jgi:hypothetical protein